MAKPSFLIIGGGFAGVTLAQHLSDVADVTVLDRKEFLELNVASLRALVQPGFEDQIAVPYRDIKGLGRAVCGCVKAMSTSSVTLDSGETIAFEYAAICTGSTYSDIAGKGLAKAVDERKQELKDYRLRVQSAKSIIIVGGGPAGVEVAGEILTDCPAAKVTIVHAHSKLLNNRNTATSVKAEKWLRSHGAQLLLSQRAEVGTDGSLTLSNGQTLKADLVIWCHRTSPNTAFFKGTELEGALDASGYIQVDKHLNLIGHSNIWAIGDCNNVPETKMAFLAEKQAEMVAANFKARLKNRRAKQAGWTPGWLPFDLMMISLGRSYGLFQLGWFVLSGWIPTMIKSRTMMVDMIKKNLHITA